MRKTVAAVSMWLLAVSLGSVARADSDPNLKTLENIKNEVFKNGRAYANLRELTAIGPRLSGSTQAERAVQWGMAKMQSYGFDKVWLQPVKVPKWERGKIASAEASGLKFQVVALGGSPGTPLSGIEAPVIEVQSLDEVASLGAKVRGKIVFYNRPMDATLVNTFEAYGKAGDQRFSGPKQASKFGAVAVLVRSLTTGVDDYPHTGITKFGDNAPIPAAALSTLGADRLSMLLKKNPDARMKVKLGAKSLGMVDSYNVIGELTGAELPSEIVLVGGHLDSWDLATGAQDDGAGVVQSIEVLRAMKALGIHPRRTVRAVLFMSEEFGGIGGEEYERQAEKNSSEKHIAAIESDNGGFTPLGFSMVGTPASFDRFKNWRDDFAPLHCGIAALSTEGESDVDPLKKIGTTLFSLTTDSQRYFDVHHSALDTIDAVNARELELGATAMTVLTYLISERGI